MRTTIRDIAAKTGFSIATVSMILNGKDSHISEATRNIVLTAAKEMNYVPNQAAITFKNRRSYLLGLICPDITNDFYSRVAKGLVEATEKQGYNVVLCNTDASPERESRFIDAFCGKNVDGAIVFSTAFTNSEDVFDGIRKLESFGIPVIRMDKFPGNVSFKNVSFVLLDYYKGGSLAAEHFLSLGHRDVAILRGPQQYTAATMREEGFFDTMASAGYPVAESRVFDGSWSYESGVEAADAIIQSGATAVFATNDMMALGLIHELRKKGVMVPEDISVIGFDNVLTGEISEVHLTTIDNPAYESGKKAGEILCDIIEKRAEPGESSYLDPGIIIRSSTAPAKQK